MEFHNKRTEVTQSPKKTSPTLGSAGVSPANNSPKGWYSRNYLPHCDTPGLIQAITFRLADALPKAVLQRLAAIENGAEKRKILEDCMDAGHGACYLRNARCASIVEQALLHYDGNRYRLLAWCIILETSVGREKDM